MGALGALVGYATDPATVGYQPMHVNFGLVPPLEDGKRRSKRDRYQAYADRALEALAAYLATRSDLFGGDRSSPLTCTTPSTLLSPISHAVRGFLPTR